MMEQRQFHRVKVTQGCTVTYRETVCRGQVENISLNGAVIRLAERAETLAVGVICLLTVYFDEDVRPLKLNAEVIHNTSDLIGVKFVPLDAEGQDCLVHLVEQYTNQAEKLATELDSIKWHIDKYLDRVS